MWRVTCLTLVASLQALSAPMRSVAESPAEPSLGMSPGDFERFHCIFVSRNGAFDPEKGNHVTDLFGNYAEKHPKRNLVVHFHGGLVDRPTGLEKAHKLNAAYFDEGGAYPVYFIWESGINGTVKGMIDPYKDSRSPQYIVLSKLLDLFHIERSARVTGSARVCGSLQDSQPAPNELTVEEKRILAAALESDATLKAMIVEVKSGKQNLLSQFLEKTAREEASVKSLRLIKTVDVTPQSKKINWSTGIPKNASTVPMGSVLDKASSGRISLESSAGKVREEMLSNPTFTASVSDSIADRLLAAWRSNPLAVLIPKAIAIAGKVKERVATGHSHSNLHATIVEELLRAFGGFELGNSIWHSMINKQMASFERQPDRAGAVFLNGLSDYLWNLKRQNRPLPRITLVGHSAGAIYICELLEQADQWWTFPPETKFEVVFLAPACRFHRLSQTLSRCGPNRQDGKQPRISHFRMFGLNDKWEQGDSMIADVSGPALRFLYPLSLLYFISGELEYDQFDDAPVVGMQRFHSGSVHFSPQLEREIADVKSFLAGQRVGVVWSSEEAQQTTRPDGTRSSAKKHGGFDEEPVTLSSLAWILKHGF